jgi:N-carbamoyl-L-amino-acid hydrolase
MDRRRFTSTLVASALLGSLPRPLWGDPAARLARIDGARLNRRLLALREFGGTDSGGTHRLGYSEADKAARVAVTQWMREAGLTPRVDEAGNLIGSRVGTARDLPPLLFGSHIDSVPDGGNYDGNLGTIAAIDVAQALQEQGRTLRHPIEVCVWANEEGGLYGSRAVSGQFAAHELALTTTSGKTVEDGIRFLGGDPARLDRAVRRRGDIAGYFELHIEQGGVLEGTNTAVGVVEGIVGIKWWDVTITGMANHAGTTPMDQRRDAMLAAGRFIDLVNRVVRATPGSQVGTVGRLRALPGAPNVIPGTVVCSLELRDLSDAKIDALYTAITREATAIAEATGTSFAYQALHINEAAPSDPLMRSVIADAAGALGVSARVMPSGAGHDAQAIAQLGPMGMIFIPSVGGISHSPKEYSTPEHCALGGDILLHAVLAADATLSR